MLSVDHQHRDPATTGFNGQQQTKGVKKGRFRVVKGVTGVEVDSSPVMSVAPLDFSRPTSAAQAESVVTVKKGRFVVRKESDRRVAPSARCEELHRPSEEQGQNAKGEYAAVKKVGRFVVKKAVDGAVPKAGNDLAEKRPVVQPGDEVAFQNNTVAAVKKVGRFVVKKGIDAGNQSTRSAEAGGDMNDRGTPRLNADRTLEPPVSESPPPQITKKKGRFLVKTGASTSDLAGERKDNDLMRRRNSFTSQIGQPLETLGSANIVMDAPIVTAKKKGRFVVKKGNAAALPELPPIAAPNATMGIQGKVIDLPPRCGFINGTGHLESALCHLESMRTDMVEAAKSIASYQSENRILLERNRELEARVLLLERLLVDEQNLRILAETRLAQQLAQQNIENASPES